MHLSKYSETEQDKVTTLMGQLIGFAKEKSQVDTLLEWLSHGQAVNGISLSYYNKWAIVK